MTAQVLEGRPIPEVDILLSSGVQVWAKPPSCRKFCHRLTVAPANTILRSKAGDSNIFVKASWIYLRYLRTASSPPSGPLTFGVTLSWRPYKSWLCPLTSTLFIDPFRPAPSFAIIAFSIPSRESFHKAQYYWRKQLSLHYHDLEHSMPVMLLGLKRDERT